MTRPALAVACLLATLAGASPALADPAERTAPVAVRVIVAHAIREPGRIDPACKDLEKQISSLGFGSLHMVRKEILMLRMGQRGAMPLPSGSELRIVPLSIIRERLNMRVEVPGAVNTRLQMHSGRPVIVGGPRHEGGHLIVQIVPEY